MDTTDVWTSPPACSPVHVTTAVCGTGLMMDETTHWAGGLWGQALAMPVHSRSKRNACRAPAPAGVVELSPRTTGNCGLDGYGGCLDFSACLSSGECDDGCVWNGTGDGRDDALGRRVMGAGFGHVRPLAFQEERMQGDGDGWYCGDVASARCEES